VLTAFFLEATFLGVMLFGHGRCQRAHAPAGHLPGGVRHDHERVLDPGAQLSWMQTPAGFEIEDGKFHVTDWMQVIFNPSFPYRLAHVLLASALTVAFLLAGVAAWQLLKGTANRSTAQGAAHRPDHGRGAIPLQMLVGDLHGLNTLEHQPAKVAAMEGIWQTEKGAPLCCSPCR
jgi:cytochrome d ubiquinol oxidase subunit I